MGRKKQNRTQGKQDLKKQAAQNSGGTALWGKFASWAERTGHKPTEAESKSKTTQIQDVWTQIKKQIRPDHFDENGNFVGDDRITPDFIERKFTEVSDQRLAARPPKPEPRQFKAIDLDKQAQADAVGKLPPVTLSTDTQSSHPLPDGFSELFDEIQGFNPNIPAMDINASIRSYLAKPKSAGTLQGYKRTNDWKFFRDTENKIYEIEKARRAGTISDEHHQEMQAYSPQYQRKLGRQAVANPTDFRRRRESELRQRDQQSAYFTNVLAPTFGFDPSSALDDSITLSNDKQYGIRRVRRGDREHLQFGAYDQESKGFHWSNELGVVGTGKDGEVGRLTINNMLMDVAVATEKVNPASEQAQKNAVRRYYATSNIKYPPQREHVKARAAGVKDDGDATMFVNPAMRDYMQPGTVARMESAVVPDSTLYFDREWDAPFEQISSDPNDKFSANLRQKGYTHRIGRGTHFSQTETQSREPNPAHLVGQKAALDIPGYYEKDGRIIAGVADNAPKFIKREQLGVQEIIYTDPTTERRFADPMGTNASGLHALAESYSMFLELGGDIFMGAGQGVYNIDRVGDLEGQSGQSKEWRIKIEDDDQRAAALEEARGIIDSGRSARSANIGGNNVNISGSYEHGYIDNVFEEDGTIILQGGQYGAPISDKGWGTKSYLTGAKLDSSIQKYEIIEQLSGDMTQVMTKLLGGLDPVIAAELYNRYGEQYEENTGFEAPNFFYNKESGTFQDRSGQDLRYNEQTTEFLKSFFKDVYIPSAIRVEQRTGIVDELTYESIFRQGAAINMLEGSNPFMAMGGAEQQEIRDVLGKSPIGAATRLDNGSYRVTTNVIGLAADRSTTQNMINRLFGGDNDTTKREAARLSQTLNNSRYRGGSISVRPELSQRGNSAVDVETRQMINLLNRGGGQTNIWTNKSGIAQDQQREALQYMGANMLNRGVGGISKPDDYLDINEISQEDALKYLVAYQTEVGGLPQGQTGNAADYTARANALKSVFGDRADKMIRAQFGDTEELWGPSINAASKAGVTSDNKEVGFFRRFSDLMHFALGLRANNTYMESVVPSNNKDENSSAIVDAYLNSLQDQAEGEEVKRSAKGGGRTGAAFSTTPTSNVAAPLDYEFVHSSTMTRNLLDALGETGTMGEIEKELLDLLGPNALDGLNTYGAAVSAISQNEEEYGYGYAGYYIRNPISDPTSPSATMPMKIASERSAISEAGGISAMVTPGKSVINPIAQTARAGDVDADRGITAISNLNMGKMGIDSFLGANGQLKDEYWTYKDTIDADGNATSQPVVNKDKLMADLIRRRIDMTQKTITPDEVIAAAKAAPGSDLPSYLLDAVRGKTSGNFNRDDNLAVITKEFERATDPRRSGYSTEQIVEGARVWHQDHKGKMGEAYNLRRDAAVAVDTFADPRNMSSIDAMRAMASLSSNTYQPALDMSKQSSMALMLSQISSTNLVTGHYSKEGSFIGFAGRKDQGSSNLFSAASYLAQSVAGMTEISPLDAAEILTPMDETDRDAAVLTAADEIEKARSGNGIASWAAQFAGKQWSNPTNYFERKGMHQALMAGAALKTVRSSGPEGESDINSLSENQRGVVKNLAKLGAAQEAYTRLMSGKPMNAEDMAATLGYLKTFTNENPNSFFAKNVIDEMTKGDVAANVAPMSFEEYLAATDRNKSGASSPAPKTPAPQQPPTAIVQVPPYTTKPNISWNTLPPSGLLNKYADEDNPLRGGLLSAILGKGASTTTPQMELGNAVDTALKGRFAEQTAGLLGVSKDQLSFPATPKDMTADGIALRGIPDVEVRDQGSNPMVAGLTGGATATSGNANAIYDIKTMFKPEVTDQYAAQVGAYQIDANTDQGGFLFVNSSVPINIGGSQQSLTDYTRGAEPAQLGVKTEEWLDAAFNSPNKNQVFRVEGGDYRPQASAALREHSSFWDAVDTALGTGSAGNPRSQRPKGTAIRGSNAADSTNVNFENLNSIVSSLGKQAQSSGGHSPTADAATTALSKLGIGASLIDKAANSGIDDDDVSSAVFGPNGTYSQQASAWRSVRKAPPPQQQTAPQMATPPAPTPPQGTTIPAPPTPPQQQPPTPPTPPQQQPPTGIGMADDYALRSLQAVQIQQSEAATHHLANMSRSLLDISRNTNRERVYDVNKYGTAIAYLEQNSSAIKDIAAKVDRGDALNPSEAKILKEATDHARMVSDVQFSLNQGKGKGIPARDSATFMSMNVSKEAREAANLLADESDPTKKARRVQASASGTVKGKVDSRTAAQVRDVIKANRARLEQEYLVKVKAATNAGKLREINRWYSQMNSMLGHGTDYNNAAIVDALFKDEIDSKAELDLQTKTNQLYAKTLQSDDFYDDPQNLDAIIQAGSQDAIYSRRKARGVDDIYYNVDANGNRTVVSEDEAEQRIKDKFGDDAIGFAGEMSESRLDQQIVAASHRAQGVQKQNTAKEASIKAAADRKAADDAKEAAKKAREDLREKERKQKELARKQRLLEQQEKKDKAKDRRAAKTLAAKKRTAKINATRKERERRRKEIDAQKQQAAQDAKNAKEAEAKAVQSEQISRAAAEAVQPDIEAYAAMPNQDLLAVINDTAYPANEQDAAEIRHRKEAAQKELQQRYMDARIEAAATGGTAPNPADYGDTAAVDASFDEAIKNTGAQPGVAIRQRIEARKQSHQQQKAKKEHQDAITAAQAAFGSTKSYKEAVAQFEGHAKGAAYTTEQIKTGLDAIQSLSVNKVLDSTVGVDNLVRTRSVLGASAAAETAAKELNATTATKGVSELADALKELGEQSDVNSKKSRELRKDIMGIFEGIEEGLTKSVQPIEAELKKLEADKKRMQRADPSVDTTEIDKKISAKQELVARANTAYEDLLQSTVTVGGQTKTVQEHMADEKGKSRFERATIDDALGSLMQGRRGDFAEMIKGGAFGDTRGERAVNLAMGFGGYAASKFLNSYWQFQQLSNATINPLLQSQEVYRATVQQQAKTVAQGIGSVGGVEAYKDATRNEVAAERARYAMGMNFDRSWGWLQEAVSDSKGGLGGIASAVLPAVATMASVATLLPSDPKIMKPTTRSGIMAGVGLLTMGAALYGSANSYINDESGEGILRRGQFAEGLRSSDTLSRIGTVLGDLGAATGRIAKRNDRSFIASEQIGLSAVELGRGFMSGNLDQITNALSYSGANMKIDGEYIQMPAGAVNLFTQEITADDLAGLGFNAEEADYIKSQISTDEYGKLKYETPWNVSKNDDVIALVEKKNAEAAARTEANRQKFLEYSKSIGGIQNVAGIPAPIINAGYAAVRGELNAKGYGNEQIVAAQGMTSRMMGLIEGGDASYITKAIDAMISGIDVESYTNAYASSRNLISSAGTVGGKEAYKATLEEVSGDLDKAKIVTPYLGFLEQYNTQALAGGAQTMRPDIFAGYLESNPSLRGIGYFTEDLLNYASMSGAYGETTADKWYETMRGYSKAAEGDQATEQQIFARNSMKTRASVYGDYSRGLSSIGFKGADDVALNLVSNIDPKYTAEQVDQTTSLMRSYGMDVRQFTQAAPAVLGGAISQQNAMGINFQSSAISGLVASGANTFDSKVVAEAMEKAVLKFDKAIEEFKSGLEATDLNDAEKNKLIQDKTDELKTKITYEELTATGTKAARQGGFGLGRYGMSSFEGLNEEQVSAMMGLINSDVGRATTGFKDSGVLSGKISGLIKDKEYTEANRLLGQKEWATGMTVQAARYSTSNADLKSKSQILEAVASISDPRIAQQVMALIEGDPYAASAYSASKGFAGKTASMYVQQTGIAGGTIGFAAGYDENLLDPRMAPIKQQITEADTKHGGFVQKYSSMTGTDFSGVNTVQAQNAIKQLQFEESERQFSVGMNELKKQRSTTYGGNLAIFDGMTSAGQIGDLSQAAGLNVFKDSITKQDLGSMLKDFIAQGGQWGLEDSQIKLQRAQQDYGMMDDERRRKIAEERFGKDDKNWYERWQFNWDRTMEQLDWQKQDMSRSQTQQRTKMQWQGEDLAFQRNQTEIGFAWQMEDADRNIRYARGRERRDLMRNQERSVIQHSMAMGQQDKQESRFEQEKKWAEEQMKIDEQRYERNRYWTIAQMEMEKRHHEQDKDFAKKELEWNKEALDKKREWMLQERALDDRARGARRAMYLLEQTERENLFAISRRQKLMMDGYAAQIEAIAQRNQYAQMALQNMIKMGDLLKEVAQGFAEVRIELEKIKGASKGGRPGGGSQYADGGYTGSGGKYEPAGIVHKGEYVVPQQGAPVVRGDNPKTVELLERIAKAIEDSGATGGQINVNITAPDAATASQAVLSLRDKAYQRK